MHIDIPKINKIFSFSEGNIALNFENNIRNINMQDGEYSMVVITAEY